MVGRDPFLLMTLNFMIYFPGVCPLLNVSHQKSYIQINMTSIKNKNMSQRVSSMLPISPSNKIDTSESKRYEYGVKDASQHSFTDTRWCLVDSYKLIGYDV